MPNTCKKKVYKYKDNEILKNGKHFKRTIWFQIIQKINAIILEVFSFLSGADMIRASRT